MAVCGLRTSLARMISCTLLTLGFATASTATPEVTQTSVQPSVDAALVLAVDVSSSIDQNERRFQREAYASALSDPRIASLVLKGGRGSIAIAYMEWSGPNVQRIAVPMRVLSSPDDFAEISAAIRSVADDNSIGMAAATTAIGSALLAAERVLDSTPVRAKSYVIDISGDGTNNSGPDVVQIRDRLIRRGITINGLPLAVGIPGAYGGPEVVEAFYENCVIGGDGSFHLVAETWDDVRETLVAKMALELAGLDYGPDARRRIADRLNGRAASILHPATALNLNQAPSAAQPSFNCSNPYASLANTQDP